MSMRTNYNPSLFLRGYGRVFDKFEAKFADIEIECFFIVAYYKRNQAE